MVEASAILDVVNMFNSTVGNKTVTIVTNLISGYDITKPPSFTFKSIVVSVTQGTPLRVIYYWQNNFCNGPALCTASLISNCSEIVVAVSSSNFVMPTIVLKYLDAGNNPFDVDSTKLAPNNQQVFLNTSSQPRITCPVPQAYSKFASIVGNTFNTNGATLPDSTQAYPYFERPRANLASMSDALNSNRLIAGSRFLITMNGNTFKSGVDPIANVDNNVLVMNIVYGNTTLLAVVNDNWNSRVSTVNVSLGSLS